MKGSEYRLGEYKIVEYEDGELSWESHFGFAALREGRYFSVHGSTKKLAFLRESIVTI